MGRSRSRSRERSDRSVKKENGDSVKKEKERDRDRDKDDSSVKKEKDRREEGSTKRERDRENDRDRERERDRDNNSSAKKDKDKERDSVTKKEKDSKRERDPKDRSKERDRRSRSHSKERWKPPKSRSRSRSRGKRDKHKTKRARESDDEQEEYDERAEKVFKNVKAERELAQNVLNAPAGFDITKARLKAIDSGDTKMTRADKEAAALARLFKRKNDGDYLERKSTVAAEHWRDKRLNEMTERDWRIFKEDFNISTRGFQVAKPIRNWDEAALPDKLMKAIRKVGYKDPTPIQRAAIPVGLTNRDIVGIAETGSGKTCAYLLPMLVYITDQPRITQETSGDGPYAIILAPTRELAKQIAEESEKFAKILDFRTVSIVGGESYNDQGISLREGAEIIIATPGRMFDCIERRILVLSRCNYVVLDEADRMIDMNFEPQIIKIMDEMPSSNLRPEINEEDPNAEIDTTKRYRQTIMFSATMPLKVEMLAKKYLRHPIFISIGDRKGNASENVTQLVEWHKENSKRNRLMEIFGEESPPGIIFLNTQHGCNSLMKFVQNAGFTTTVLHAGRTQEQREANLASFKNKEVDYLIATDVAARGIDVTGVQFVVNFDMPKDIEKYTHRIGRTGRAGLKGTAYSFVTAENTDIMFDLVEMLKKTGHAIPTELREHKAAKEKPGTVSDKPKRDTIIYAK